jgi:hypothetical protein
MGVSAEFGGHSAELCVCSVAWTHNDRATKWGANTHLLDAPGTLMFLLHTLAV